MQIPATTACMDSSTISLPHPHPRFALHKSSTLAVDRGLTLNASLGGLEQRCRF